MKIFLSILFVSLFTISASTEVEATNHAKRLEWKDGDKNSLYNLKITQFNQFLDR